MSLSTECSAALLSFKYPSQDLKRIYKREYEFPNSSLFNRVHCANFYQSALRHEQHEDVIPSFRVDFSKKCCSDLPVKGCEGDRD